MPGHLSAAPTGASRLKIEQRGYSPSPSGILGVQRGRRSVIPRLIGPDPRRRGLNKFIHVHAIEIEKRSKAFVKLCAFQSLS